MLHKLIFSFLALMSFLGCSDLFKKNSVPLIGQENAIWTESLYLRGYRPSSGEKLTDEHLRTYAFNLKKNKIKYAYLFAGPYEEDGRLPDYAFSKLARKSIEKLRKHYPEIIILPWIGGVQNKTVYLGDSLWVENALNDTKRLVETLGVQGVHIDFEYIIKGDSYLDTTIGEEREFDQESYGNNVNTFHKKIRALLPDSFISSVVVSTAPDTKPWKRKTSIEELLVLTEHVDQISFLFYDTSISSQKTFQYNCIKQIEDIRFLRKVNSETQYLLSIGTFVNRVELHKYRDLNIENIPNSLRTIKESTVHVSSKELLIDGISIFCDWQTSEKEWEEFYVNWGTN